MNKLLMALLPSNIKAMLEVSQKIFQNIENDTQRKNIYNFIDIIYYKENKKIKIDKEDEIIKGVLMNGDSQ